VKLPRAAAWYEQRRDGLGWELVAEVERVLLLIGENPLRFPRLLDVPEELAIRRALLARFPYAVVFMDMVGEVRVVAVAHARRRPGFWLGRVRP
jgi:hypothetical protein